MQATSWCFIYGIVEKVHRNMLRQLASRLKILSRRQRSRAVRALDFLAIQRPQVHGPPWPLAGFVHGSLVFKSSTTLVNSQLVCLLPLGFLTILCSVWIIGSLSQEELDNEVFFFLLFSFFKTKSIVVNWTIRELIIILSMSFVCFYQSCPFYAGRGGKQCCKQMHLNRAHGAQCKYYRARVHDNKSYSSQISDRFRQFYFSIKSWI